MVYLERSNLKHQLETDKELYDFFKTDKNLGDNVVLLAIGGSHAYGLADKHSDLDIRGIAIEREEVLLGLDNFESRTYISKDSTDIVIHSLSKFVYLALKGNLNIIELLYSNAEDILKVNEYVLPFIENADMFLSKRMYQPMRGIVRSYVSIVQYTNRGDRKHSKAIKRIARIMALSYDVFTCHEFHTNVSNLSMYGACISMLETIDRCSKDPGKDILKVADSFMADCYEKSDLKEEPDKEKIERLLIDVHKSYLLK